MSLAFVELSQDFFGHSLQKSFWEHSQNSPGDVETLKDGSVFKLALLQELGFEIIQEVEVYFIIRTDGILSYDLLDVLNLLCIRVAVVQLVGDVLVVFARHALTDGGLHQTRKGWQRVKGWVQPLVGQFSGNEDLALGDVSSQIWDGVGDIVVWQSQDRDLGDGTAGKILLFI